MDNDRTRPFLLEPVYHGAPASGSQKYFQSRLRRYRGDYPEFDEYLIGIGNEIRKRELTFCDNILLFIQGEAKTNWISPTRSLFRTFIKFFNYDFSIKQTVDYIEKCHSVYESLMSNDYELSEEYKIFSKACCWDNNTRDFIHLYLDPINKPKDLDDYFWVEISFCSLQINDLGPDDFCDTEIKLVSGRNIYQDALCLFEYYQGSRFSHKCLNIAISELTKHHVIDKPNRVIKSFVAAFFYRINKPHSFKFDEKHDD